MCLCVGWAKSDAGTRKKGNTGICCVTLGIQNNWVGNVSVVNKEKMFRSIWKA